MQCNQVPHYLLVHNSPERPAAEYKLTVPKGIQDNILEDICKNGQVVVGFLVQVIERDCDNVCDGVVLGGLIVQVLFQDIDRI